MARRNQSEQGYLFPTRGQWILMGVGGGLCLLAALLAWFYLIPGGPRVLIAFVGLLLVGGAVYWKRREPLGKTLDQRAWTMLFVFVAGFCAILAWKATAWPEWSRLYLWQLLEGVESIELSDEVRETSVRLSLGWDSMGLLLLVMAFVALTGGILIVLPLKWRKFVGSLMILYHFGGICTAATAVPALGHVPWLPTQIWTHFYRPYLYFMYLNNAYHFYSPEPGPPTLIWFRIEYEGEAKPRWVRISERKDYITRLQYQRFLAMTESVSVYSKTDKVPPDKLTKLYERRYAIDNPGGRGRDWWRTDERPRKIKPYPGLDLSVQYRQINQMARLYLRGYVQHVARYYPSLTNPNAKVKRIQVYELIHNIMSAAQFAEGYDPLDPAMYRVYYLGPYTEQGELIRPKISEAAPRHLGLISYQVLDGRGNPRLQVEEVQDLYLYWMLPIYREPRVPNPNPKDPKDWRLIDSLQLHTGDNRETLWDR